MRYQIRLMDQNLPGLTRQLALAAWRAVDGMASARVPDAVYRELFRGVREVFRARVKAFRFCGGGAVCGGSIPGKRLATEPRHEAWPNEHVHIYLMEEGPAEIVAALVLRSVRSVVRAMPSRNWKGLTEALRRAFARTLEGDVFPSVRCQEAALCHANEEYDPWDLRDPVNAVAGAR